MTTTAPEPTAATAVADTRPVRLAPLHIPRLGLLGSHTRRMRAALSALGISIGVATMIVVTGIPASSQKALMNQLSALGTNMLQAVPVPNQTPPVQLPPQSVDMVRRIGPVTVAGAVANTHVEVFRNDRVDADDHAGLAVPAGRTDLLEAINAEVRSGRYLGASTERFPTAVLGSVAATRMGMAAGVHPSIRASRPTPTEALATA
ncbi:ABC transporter permease [Streptomyces sp. NPDC001100]